MRMVWGLMLCLAVSTAATSIAQDAKQAEDEKILAYVPKNVRRFTVFRPAQIFNSPDMAKFKKAAGNKFDRYFDRILNRFLKFGLADLEEIDALVNADWIIRKEKDGHQYSMGHSVLILRTVEANLDRFDLATHAVKAETEFKDKTIFTMKKPLDGMYQFSCILDDKTIVWSSSKESVQHVIESGKTGPAKSDFYTPWRRFAEHDISFLLSADEQELEYSPEPIKALKDVKFLVGGAELGEESKVDAVAHCQSQSKAEAILALAKSQMKIAETILAQQVKTNPAQKEGFDILKKLIQSAKIQRQRNKVKATATLKLDFDELTEPLGNIYAAQKRTEAANNARQQALAMLNFESAYGKFPSSTMVHKSGKKYSWRIAILPFIERMDIYEKYDFTQDWNSPHNLEVTSEMPDFFRSDMDDRETTNTSFFLLTGPGGAFGGEDPITISSFADGTSNTVMAIEAKRDVHWAKPEDIEIGPDGELPAFGGYHEGGFNMVRVDGSVQFLPENVAEDYLRQLFTPAGGEIPSSTIPLKDDEQSEK